MRTVFGFGDALVAMPLLALFLDLKTATPLVALVSAINALTILIKDRKNVRLRSAWLLIASTAAGIPIGLIFLKNAPEILTKAVLAILLIGFSLFQLIGRGSFILKKRWPALPFGFTAGILGAAYNTNGPPVVIYGLLRRWHPAEFRATLQSYFFSTGLLVIAGHGIAGLWTKDVFIAYAWSLPGIFLAIWIGNHLHRSLDEDLFKKILYLLLIAVGLMLIVRIFI